MVLVKSAEQNEGPENKKCTYGLQVRGFQL